MGELYGRFGSPQQGALITEGQYELRRAHRITPAACLHLRVDGRKATTCPAERPGVLAALVAAAERYQSEMTERSRCSTCAAIPDRLPAAGDSGPVR